MRGIPVHVSKLSRHGLGEGSTVLPKGLFDNLKAPLATPCLDFKHITHSLDANALSALRSNEIDFSATHFPLAAPLWT